MEDITFYREPLSAEITAKIQNDDDLDAWLYFSDGSRSRGYLVLQYEIPVTGQKILLFSEDLYNGGGALIIYPVLYREVNGSAYLYPAGAPEVSLLADDVRESLTGVIAETSRGLFRKKPTLAPDPQKTLNDIRC